MDIDAVSLRICLLISSFAVTVLWMSRPELYLSLTLRCLFALYVLYTLLDGKTVACVFSLYSGTQPSYLTDLLSPRLVGAVEARINVRCSYSQQGLAAAWIQTPVVTVASPAL